MPVCLRDIFAWLAFVAMLPTLLMSSGVMVYCVGPGDHAGIELVHGQQPCGGPVDGQGETPGVDWGTQVVSASECVDQPMVEDMLPSIVHPSSGLVVASAASLLYELPPVEALQASRIFSRWQAAPVHPDVSVVQAVVLLI